VRDSDIVRTFLGIRVAYWLVAAISLLWAPIRDSAAQPPFRAWLGLGDWLFDTFAQWDSVWFLHIARYGYDSKEATAFFPLYPLLVRGVAEVVRSDVAAAVLVSLAAGTVAVLVLHRLARPLLGPRGANTSVLLVALYPIAFVFTAAYSDGLFLALASGSFLAATQRRSLAAGVLGGLACATRLVGLGLLPALVVLLWPRRRREILHLVPLVLLPAAVGGYALYLDRHVGDAWVFLHAQGVFWHRHVHHLGPIDGLWLSARDGYQGTAEILRHLPRAPHGAFAHRDQWSAWNAVQFALLAAAAWLTWVAWRRLGAAYGLYSLATLVIVLSSPADLVPLVSLPRFLLGDFPLFFVLADFCERRPRLRAVLLTAFAAIGGMTSVAFAHHVWIA
jgi:Dolichyl-phosphate-mannose-protein mannosyltransferase